MSTHRNHGRRHKVLVEMKLQHNQERNDAASRVLTQYLINQAVVPGSEDLCCMETALRVDIVDECDALYRLCWNQFRADLSALFHRETGLYLPPCCRFPRSNLYLAYRQSHQEKDASC